MWCGIWMVIALGQEAAAVSNTEIVKALQPSLVRVEYTLRYDKADRPELMGWGQRWSNCGEIHSLGDGSSLVQDERPLEMAGFVLSEDKVISADAMIHPRFVEKIMIRYQDQVVAAKPAAYLLDQPAVIYQLEKPLQNVMPLQFAKSDKRPFNAIRYAEQNGLWTVNLEKMSETLTVREDGQTFLSGPSGCLVVDANGIPLGINFGEKMPLDDSWQQSPLSWRALSAQQMEQTLADFEGKVARGLLRVKMNFRSPNNAEPDFRRYSSQEENDSATEIHTAGVMIDPNHILILSELKPKVTARLERILIYPSKRLPIEAQFVGTLSNYGGLIAEFDQPLTQAPVVMATEPITAFEQNMLLYADLRIKGENRDVYFGHSRISSFTLGWRRQIEPSLAVMAQNRFLFDLDGRLVAMPLSRRKKVASEEDRWSMGQPRLVACVYLQPVLQAYQTQLDASNIPLTEEEENRIAWLGIELQALNPELARINKVSDQTRDGEMGAMISYVYEPSPASDAGLQMGDILIRLYIENQNRPLEVFLDEDFGDMMEMFPWEQLSEIPEEYFSQLPTPWPSAENTFIRAVSDLGFGTKFKAEIFRNGELLMKDFVVTQSPPHYGSAKRYKSAPLGLTVRNLTYEVRRYFRLTPEDPGIIVSKLEQGSKASVSGIRPYEIITHVNATPVMDVNDFEKLIQSGGELKLSVKRMTKGRVVNLNVDDAVSKDPNESVDIKDNDEAEPQPTDGNQLQIDVESTD